MVVGHLGEMIGWRAGWTVGLMVGWRGQWKDGGRLDKEIGGGMCG